MAIERLSSLAQAGALLLSLLVFLVLYRRLDRLAFRDWIGSWVSLIAAVSLGWLAGDRRESGFYFFPSQLFLLLHAGLLLRGAWRYRRESELSLGPWWVWLGGFAAFAGVTTAVGSGAARFVPLQLALAAAYLAAGLLLLNVPTPGAGRWLASGALGAWCAARLAAVRLLLVAGGATTAALSIHARFLEAFLVLAFALGVAVLTFEADEARLSRASSDLSMVEGRLREMAMRDPLTGLYNRFYFNDVIGRELDRVRRYGAPLAVLIGDISGFRQYNDRYGHAQADELLRFVGNFLRASIRESDVVFRWGADEFLVLLAQTDEEGATAKADELEREVRNVPGYERFHNFSISVGWAITDGSQEFPRTLQEAEGRRDAARKTAHHG